MNTLIDLNNVQDCCGDNSGGNNGGPETDPTVPSWVKQITPAQIIKWDTIQPPVQETDPTVPIWVKNITEEQILGWNSPVDGTETDPTVPQWVKQITSEQITKWDTGQAYEFRYIDFPANGILNVDGTIRKVIATSAIQLNGLLAPAGMTGILIVRQDDLGGHVISLYPGNKGATIVLNTNPRAETRLSWERYDNTVYWKNEVLDAGIIPTTVPIFAINDYYNILDIYHNLGYSQIEISTNNGPWVQFTGPLNIGAVDRPAGYWRARVKALEPDRLISGISYSVPVYAAQTGFDYVLNLNLS